MRKYIFEIGENFIVKTFKVKLEKSDLTAKEKEQQIIDKAFEQAMDMARKLHKALELPIRFYPLTDESATVINSNG